MNPKAIHKQTARAILFVLSVILVTVGLLAMASCTLATYADADGRELLVLDLRLSGTETRVSVTRPDGTRININRDQDSPETTVTGVINAANPIGGILP